jgi:histidine triad (HIT) family protein
MNTTCLFCRIINKEIPASIILESEEIIVFKDINPKDNTHLLVVPKNHTNDLNTFSADTIDAKAIFEAFKDLGKLLKDNHYKIQVNNGSKSGQEILHLHFHFISSSKLKSTGLSK